ncbi:hypothetical protein FRC02_005165 [Tulasnella sp. 418]|nr:hypothetical protein FRC02_005165 [Tulasnella sp. 418]
MRELNQIIDNEMPEVPTWHTFTIKLDDMDEEFEVHYRDPLAIIKAILANPEFADKMAFAPEKQWSDKDRKSRLYNEMHTGDWWWNAQRKVKTRGASIIPVIVGTDKSQLTTFSGNLEAYPGYLMMGNIFKAFCRKVSKNAYMLLALLPMAQFKNKGMSKKDQRLTRARVFHHAMKEIFKSLEDAGRNGVHLVTCDGKVRLCSPILACYVADYPEQCLVACICYGECPICPCMKKQMGEYGDMGEPRTQAQTSHILAQAQSKGPSWTAIDRYLRGFGVTGTFDPFSKNLPHANIHMAIVPDILHQLHQGMIKHLTSWIQHLIGPKELDKRLQCMPPNHSLRVYQAGISGFSKLTGNEHRQLAKQLLGCIADYAASPVVKATQALLEFLETAQYQSHLDETLKYLEEALQLFHKHKDVFIKLGAREGNNFNLPKLHSLLHYENAIKMYGTTDGYSTEMTECMHIEVVKIPYCASNCQDVIPQIMMWLERKEKVTKLGQFTVAR